MGGIVRHRLASSRRGAALVFAFPTGPRGEGICFCAAREKIGGTVDRGGIYVAGTPGARMRVHCTVCARSRSGRRKKKGKSKGKCTCVRT
jgi:hypothetical protein